MKKYGLQLRVPPAQKASEPLPPRPPPPFAFGGDDDDDIEREISRQAAKNKALQKIEEQHKKAMEQDPSVFDYDGVYDEMKEQIVRPKIQDRTERKDIGVISQVNKTLEKRIFRVRYAMVCSSNQNRSMEAHALLKRHAFDVSSYGTGAHVKLPGPSLREPNVYDFGTPYKYMHEDLRRKDPDLYKRNGILPMLKRNLGVKNAPQRWQDNAADGCFDVVMTFEEKVFDTVIEDLNNREQKLMKSVLIINLEVKDNHEEAAVGGKLALDLCQEIDVAECWEDAIDDIVSAFERQHKRKLLYTISFY